MSIGDAISEVVLLIQNQIDPLNLPDVAFLIVLLICTYYIVSILCKLVYYFFSILEGFFSYSLRLIICFVVLLIILPYTRTTKVTLPTLFAYSQQHQQQFEYSPILLLNSMNPSSLMNMITIIFKKIVPSVIMQIFEGDKQHQNEVDKIIEIFS